MIQNHLLFTPRALGSLRKLRGENARAAESLLEKMATGQRVGHAKLSGRNGWFRARDGTNPMRVLWTWYEDPSDHDAAILVIDVGRRHRIYSDGQRAQPAQASRLEEVIFDTVAVPEVEDTAEDDRYGSPADWASWPAYRYAPDAERTQWMDFLYRDFSLSPRLTREQLDQFKTLVEEAPGRARDVAVVQGGAGSGKSVSALLAACHLHRGSVPGMANQHEHHVLYLAPERLTQKFRTFPEVEACFDTPEAHIQTLDEWLTAHLPPAEAAKPIVSLEALRKAAAHYRQSGHTLGIAPNDLQPKDALIYQAFVLNDGNRRDAAWKEHRERIEDLENLRGWWSEHLARLGGTSRTHRARALRETLPAPPEAADSSLIVVDEAQDLLLEELQTLRATWAHWNTAGHYTRLWLFGDLNQRITPSGFFWQDLPGEVGLDFEVIPFTRNYRNTRQIVAFANGIHRIAAQTASDANARQLPPSSSEHDCVAEGDPVGLLRVPDARSARRFLEDLQREDTTPHLREKMSSAAQVLCRTKPTGLRDADLVFNTPETIKGMELESCVAYRLFAASTFSDAPTFSGEQPSEEKTSGPAPYSLSEVNEWYTLVTRARTRLLIVLTDAEAARMPDHLFAACRPMAPDAARQWVLAYGSAVQFSKSPGETWRYLREMRNNGLPWRDTWEALLEVQTADASIDPARWERHARNRLSADQQRAVADEECPWLRCLALCWQGRWGHAEAALRVFQAEKADDAPAEVHAEHQRLARRIADGMEQSHHPYRAARLRARTGLQDWPDAYPLPAVGTPNTPLAEKPLTDAVKTHIIQTLSS